ncbi:MerR family transcriptional regulator [Blastochloris sulfoviridis]|uniref:MerR family transcriptional regulator n=1 Tax=Blastochloris sulfoviridis TaxID=50712 RepID=A0A5M6HV43_9HYPH|nr:MerR family transcriptional regulator [Blastochloris sulfoviridis]KAA5599508.1 MerR family transcriptional regulator [Blastochloris sulfoviridis]
MDKEPGAFRTISEVAEDLDLPQHVLRFWETRFSQIKPLKRGGGRRYYRPDDVDLLRGIRHLLYGEGYTIRGVQRILRDEGVRFVQTVWRPGEAPPAPPVDQRPIDHLPADRDFERREPSASAVAAPDVALPDRTPPDLAPPDLARPERDGPPSLDARDHPAARDRSDLGDPSDLGDRPEPALPFGPPEEGRAPRRPVEPPSPDLPPRRPVEPAGRGGLLGLFPKIGRDAEPPLLPRVVEVPIPTARTEPVVRPPEPSRPPVVEPLRPPPRPPAAETAPAPALSRENARRLQAALYELQECRRILDAALGGEGKG